VSSYQKTARRRFFDKTTACGLRGQLYVLGVRTLVALGNLECDAVANIEFIEGNTDEVVGVEEKIFLLALDGDESKSFFGLGLDSPVHRIMMNWLIRVLPNET